MGFIEKALNMQPRLQSAFSRLGARIGRPQAVRNFSNEYARWHKVGIDPFDTSGPFACQRLRRPIFIPAVTPSFRIKKSDRLFAIGSCFARGIEASLKGRGFQMESAATDFDQFEVIGNRKVTALGFTNKYTTFAMLNELTWALQPGSVFPEDSLVDLDAERCIDPHINPTLKMVNRSGTLERRRVITEVTRRIRDCRVIFLTLGLVETWYDTQAKVFLNSTPNKEMQDLFPKRYEFASTNYLQNMDNLERLHELLTAHGHPDVHIIVTTSPVPLMATFTNQDVVVANTYSKSTLRAVAQDWAASHDNVQYFPSYEVVMNSDRKVSWEDDLRHVSGGVTKHIMDVFMNSFVEP